MTALGANAGAARLYCDEDVDGRLVEALRQRGYDVESTAMAGRLNTSDEEQLAYAANMQRTLVTHNVRHFPALRRQWIEAQRLHWGIIVLIGQASVGVWLRRAENVLRHLSADELRMHLVFLGAEYDAPS